MGASRAWRPGWMVRRRLARQMVYGLLANELEANDLGTRMRRWADAEADDRRIGPRMRISVYAEIDRLTRRAARRSSYRDGLGRGDHPADIDLVRGIGEATDMARPLLSPGEGRTNTPSSQELRPRLD